MFVLNAFQQIWKIRMFAVLEQVKTLSISDKSGVCAQLQATSVMVQSVWLAYVYELGVCMYGGAGYLVKVC